MRKADVYKEILCVRKTDPGCLHNALVCKKTALACLKNVDQCTCQCIKLRGIYKQPTGSLSMWLKIKHDGERPGGLFFCVYGAVHLTKPFFHTFLLTLLPI